MRRHKIITLVIIFCYLAYLLEVERKVRQTVVPTISGISTQLFSSPDQAVLLSSAIDPR